MVGGAQELPHRGMLLSRTSSRATTPEGTTGNPITTVVLECVCTPVKILFRLWLQKFVPGIQTHSSCKGTDHGLTPKLNIYTKIQLKNIYFKNQNIYFKKNY